MPSIGLGTSSAIINGQLVPQARSFLMYPTAVGPNIQSIPASPPQTSGSGGAGMGGDDQGQAAANNPWSPVQSPVPWLIGMFVVGFLLLRYVHWGY